MSELLRRLRYLVNRRRFDDELAGDMEFHREMAAREGKARFGNPLQLREEAREAWGWTWIDRLGQDLTYTARMMRKSPAFTLAAILMLATGIAVNVAAFGFFNLVVFTPLPVKDPDTLVRLQRQAPQNYATDLPYPAMVFYREQSRTLSAVIALDFAQLTLDTGDAPVKAHFVTPNYFTELGAGAQYGRLLEPAQDGGPGAAPVVVLSHAFWQRHFGSDPTVAGRTVRMNNKAVTIAGIARAEFAGFAMSPPDAWLPIEQQPYFVQGSRLLTDFSAEADGVDVWGRLGPGVTRQTAEDELRGLAAELGRQRPNDVWKGESLAVQPGGYAQNVGGRSRTTGPIPTLRSQMLPVFGLVAALAFLILAVACGNLGGLLLARGVAREREMGLRIAVGAGSGRLVRQLLTESVVLALLGSALGLALGYALLRIIMVWTEAPAWIDLSPDWRVVAFTIGIGFAAAILFGLAPALQIARQRHRTTVTRQFLIAAQVAASCVLLIVAGLLVRALNRAVSAHPGFEYQQVVSIDPRLATHGYSEAAARTYLDSLQGRLRDLPGIESVSLALSPPLGNRRTTARGEAAGRGFDIYINQVAPQFFETMRIPLLRGRTFQTGETDVVIVSESLARLEWPAKDPLGLAYDLDGVKRTVVGVAGNARTVALNDSDAVELYQPIDQRELASMAVLVKTSGPSEGLLPFLATLTRSIAADVTPNIRTLNTLFRSKLENAERTALAATLLGVAALGLACFGIIGLVAYAVSQRTKEIGIRLALGADRAHVLGVVLQRFARPVALGLLAGVGGAAALSQVLRRELYGISHLDPVSYLAAVAVFIAAVVLAALLPARRALKVDPMRALRYE